MIAILEPHEGKPYPALPSVMKFRRKIRKPLKDTDPEVVDEYGRAVLKAIGALQVSELRREVPSFRSNCASGTWHNDGAKILAAMRQRPILLGRDTRTEEQIERAYKEAMKEKRKAENEESRNATIPRNGLRRKSA